MPTHLNLNLYGLTPFTLLDFPGQVACIVWFARCNMRCAYCHNPDIVHARARVKNRVNDGVKGEVNPDAIFAFLEKRRRVLDGIVLSGGEATLSPDLVPFVRAIRAWGYKVKLDSNGTRPTVIRQMLEEGLLDALALDYKAPADKYRAVTQHRHKERFDQTLTTACHYAAHHPAFAFEVRTTVHPDLLDEADINAIMVDLRAHAFTGTYAIQNVLTRAGKTLGGLPPPSRTLDHTLLSESQKFNIIFRNFPDDAMH